MTYQDAVVIDTATGTAQQIFPFANGQWHRDGRRLISDLANNHELYGYDAAHKQRTGILIPALTNQPGQSLCISATGHVRGPANTVVYAASLASGEQRTFTQAQFEKAFGWKNDPDQASFLKPVTAEEPSSPTPNVAELLAPLADFKESPLPAESLAANSLAECGLSDRTLVARPAAIPNVASWTVETAGHRGAAHALAYSPSGKIIATAGEDSTIRLWDEACRPVSVLVGACGPVRTLAWSRSSQFLASAGDDRVVRLWDVPGQRRLREIALPVIPQHLAWSPDAKRLAVAVVGGCWLIDISTGRAEEISFHSDNPVHWPAWSPDGKWLAVSIYHGVNVFDADTLLPARELTLPADLNAIGFVEWSPQGDVLVGMFGAHLSRIGFWDAATGEYLGEGNSPAALYPQRCRFSHDGSRVLTGSAGRHVYDVATRRVIASVPTSGTGAVDLSPDGQRLAGIRGSRVFVFDLISGAELASSSTLGVTGGGARIVPSADGRLLFVCENAELLTFDTESGKLVERVPLEDWPALFPSPVAGTIALTAGSRLAFYSTTERKLREFPGHKEHVYAVSWTQDGQRLASVEADKLLRIWDASTGAVVSTFTLSDQCDRDVTWQADNKELLVRSTNGLSLRVNADTGAILERLQGPVPPPAPLVRPAGALPDGDRRIVIEPGGVTRVESARLNRKLGTVVAELTGRQQVVIGPTGHLKASASTEPQLVYVTATADGRQTTHSPSAFRKQFDWTNDPAQATLAAIDNEPAPSPAPPAPELFAQDRLAAEKVVALGGWVRVRINGRTLLVQKVNDIPATPFEVREVEFQSAPVTDSDLEVLVGLRSLRYPSLWGCQKVTDAALTKVGSHPQLKVLQMHYSILTQAGIHLDGFPELEALNLDGLPITNAISEQLAKVPRLSFLHLRGLAITDGIAPALGNLKSLTSLHLHDTGISDFTLDRISHLPLKTLWIIGSVAASPQLTDASAVAFARLQSLRTLSIQHTAITDETLRQIVKLPILSLYINDVPGIQGAGLAAGQGSPLINLRLSSAKLEPTQMAGLAEFKKLRTLDIDARLLTTDSVRALAEFPELTVIVPHFFAADHNISLKGLSKLATMNLYGAAQLKPADYRGLVAAPNLTYLHIYQGELSPEHFEELKRIPHLKTLTLQEIKTTQANLDQFKAARPDVTVQLQG